MSVARGTARGDRPCTLRAVQDLLWTSRRQLLVLRSVTSSSPPEAVQHLRDRHSLHFTPARGNRRNRCLPQSCETGVSSAASPPLSCRYVIIDLLSGSARKDCGRGSRDRRTESWRCNIFTHEPFFRNVSSTLHAGEVVGLTGLVGAGRTELARSIFGADPFDSGELLFDGRPIRPSWPREAIKIGIGYATEDQSVKAFFTFIRFGGTSCWVHSCVARALRQCCAALACSTVAPSTEWCKSKLKRLQSDLPIRMCWRQEQLAAAGTSKRSSLLAGSRARFRCLCL